MGGDAERGAFAVGHGVDDLAATVHAVSAGEVLGIGGLTRCPVDDDAAAVEFDAAKLLEQREQGRLADRGDHEVAGNVNSEPGQWADAAVGSSAHAGADEFGAGAHRPQSDGLDCQTKPTPSRSAWSYSNAKADMCSAPRR